MDKRRRNKSINKNSTYKLNLRIPLVLLELLYTE